MHRGSHRRIAIVDPRAVRAVVTHGPTLGATFVLRDGAHLIGRHPAADIWLDDLTVSLRHAMVGWSNGALHAADLGSLNGTFVNGRRIDVAELAVGDELTVGTFQLSLLPPSPTAAA